MGKNPFSNSEVISSHWVFKQDSFELYIFVPEFWSILQAWLASKVPVTNIYLVKAVEIPNGRKREAKTYICKWLIELLYLCNL